MSTQDDGNRRTIDDTHEPDITAPSHLSEDIIGVLSDDGRLLLEDSADDPDAFTRWIAIAATSPSAIMNVRDHR